MSDPNTEGAVIYAKHLERMAAFYIECCGLQVAHKEPDHVALESAAFQLVIIAIPESIAASIAIATPPARRENTPIKLFFPVASISVVRDAAARLGGELNPSTREWHFQGRTVCDGHDPEGNVVQFREIAPSR